MLFHNAALHTPEALPGILEKLLQEGYTFVPISQIILPGTYGSDYTIDHTGTQIPAIAAPAQSTGGIPASGAACFKTGRPFQILPGRAEPEREVRPSGRGAGGPSMSADGDACPPRGGKHPFYLVCAFRVPFVKITGQPHNETAPTNWKLPISNQRENFHSPLHSTVYFYALFELWCVPLLLISLSVLQYHLDI